MAVQESNLISGGLTFQRVSDGIPDEQHQLKCIREEGMEKKPAVTGIQNVQILMVDGPWDDAGSRRQPRHVRVLSHVEEESHHRRRAVVRRAYRAAEGVFAEDPSQALHTSAARTRFSGSSGGSLVRISCTTSRQRYGSDEGWASSACDDGTWSCTGAAISLEVGGVRLDCVVALAW
jgi:hypothetical protein